MASHPSEANSAQILRLLPKLIDRAASNDRWQTYNGLEYTEREDGLREYCWSDPWREYTFTINQDGEKSEPKFRYLHPPGPILPELWSNFYLDKYPFHDAYEKAGIDPFI